MDGFTPGWFDSKGRFHPTGPSKKTYVFMCPLRKRDKKAGCKKTVEVFEKNHKEYCDCNKGQPKGKLLMVRK